MTSLVSDNTTLRNCDTLPVRLVVNEFREQEDSKTHIKLNL